MRKEYNDIFNEGLRTYDIKCTKKPTLEGKKIICDIREPAFFSSVEIYPISNIEIEMPITFINYFSATEDYEDELAIQLDQNYAPVCKAIKVRNQYRIECEEAEYVE